jgi:uridylate kinase
MSKNGTDGVYDSDPKTNPDAAASTSSPTPISSPRT